MRKNLDPYSQTIGTYATDLFTQESIKIIQNHNTENPLFLYIPYTAPHVANNYDLLQAPQEIVDKFSYIKDINRQKYAAMVFTFNAYCFKQRMNIFFERFRYSTTVWEKLLMR